MVLAPVAEARTYMTFTQAIAHASAPAAPITTDQELTVQHVVSEEGQLQLLTQRLQADAAQSGAPALIDAIQALQGDSAAPSSPESPEVDRSIHPVSSPELRQAVGASPVVRARNGHFPQLPPPLTDM